MTDNIAAAQASLTPSISGRTGLDTGLSRTGSKANLEKAGQQFESVFTGMMLKSMRQAKLADPLFDSQALDTFRDMSDQKVVQAMAEHTPLGIGKAMTDFLSRGLGAGADAGTNATGAASPQGVMPDATASQPDVNRGGGTSAP